MIQAKTYVPILKWRQGEYQALEKLTPGQKASIVPLIEVTPPDFDFETREEKKTIDQQLEKVASRISKKWGSQCALIDLGLIDAAVRMSSGEHPLAHVLNEARTFNLTLVPVTGLDRDVAYQDAVRDAHRKDGNGVALRVSLEEAADPQFGDNIEGLLEQVEFSVSDLDLIIDLRSPNFQPLQSLARIIVATLAGASVFEQARSVTVAATSFPASMAGIYGPLHFLAREEWLLYKLVISTLVPGDRKPAFGDYGISSPDLAQGDMRLLKPSANVRYAVSDGWLIAKGSNVRDNGYSQYRICCGVVISDARYLGRAYSPGSEYVDDCARGVVSTGNLTTWRWVGTNHHLVRIVGDLASLYGP